ncbi:MAG: AAA family ATPase [Candidatus Peribacteria bacterium]|jgi:predicted AAA+ superfamily ATPase|nr:AAA family ATPase [Candidatus Peribacteria bacterium]
MMIKVLIGQRRVGKSYILYQIIDELKQQYKVKDKQIIYINNVVLDYIQYATNIFLLNKVKRQNIKGKKIFEINDKYYFPDLGVRNALVGGYRQLDLSQLLKNVVFLHFKALGDCFESR